MHSWHHAPASACIPLPECFLTTELNAPFQLFSQQNLTNTFSFFQMLCAKKVTSLPCSYSWFLPLFFPPGNTPRSDTQQVSTLLLSYTSSPILRFFLRHFEMRSHNTKSGTANAIYGRAGPPFWPHAPLLHPCPLGWYSLYYRGA